MKLEGYLQIKAAAAMLGVSINTLRNWERAGKLMPIRHPVNNYRLYRRADIAALLAAIDAPVESVPQRNDPR
jgi:MerR family transcriptional regulator, copper efflux regulator